MSPPAITVIGEPWEINACDQKVDLLITDSISKSPLLHPSISLKRKSRILQIHLVTQGL